MSTQRELALNSARILSENGHTVYFAGGAVRDQLLGKLPKDYDLATSATPAQVLAALHVQANGRCQASEEQTAGRMLNVSNIPVLTGVIIVPKRSMSGVSRKAHPCIKWLK